MVISAFSLSLKTILWQFIKNCLGIIRGTRVQESDIPYPINYFIVPVRTNGDKCNLLQIELHECEWKNKAIPFAPKLPSP
jgi:hypothetical protein